MIASEAPRLRSEVRAFFQRLQAEFRDLPLRLISALAEGGDQLVAEEALALGIELMVPLPMPQADYELDFERAGSLERFRELLALPGGHGRGYKPAGRVGLRLFGHL